MNINVGEVWLARFPYEEDPSITKDRPVIVLDVETLQVLSVKVTKQPPRPYDDYDVVIIYWQEAKLRVSSTARISKVMYLDKDMFLHKIGDLDEQDFENIKDKFIEFVNNQ